MVSACICNILQCFPVFSACLQLDFLLIRVYFSLDSNVVLPICGFRKNVDISQTSRALLWIFLTLITSHIFLMRTTKLYQVSARVWFRLY